MPTTADHPLLPGPADHSDFPQTASRSFAWLPLCLLIVSVFTTASTGALLWSYTTGYSVGSCPAVANGVVYVGSYDYNVYALNAKTGAKLWSYTTGGYVGTPAVANGMVYVGSVDGNIYAFGLP